MKRQPKIRKQKLRLGLEVVRVLEEKHLQGIQGGYASRDACEGGVTSVTFICC